MQTRESSMTSDFVYFADAISATECGMTIPCLRALSSVCSIKFAMRQNKFYPQALGRYGGMGPHQERPWHPFKLLFSGILGSWGMSDKVTLVSGTQSSARQAAASAWVANVLHPPPLVVHAGDPMWDLGAGSGESADAH
jgi:hypothetical protein